MTSQETTIYSQPFNGYQIWFHSSGKGETLCGSISSRSGSTSNFWTQGDGSTIGKVEVDGSDIKMYVGGTLIRTCTGGASNTMYAHAYVFQSDSEFIVDSISPPQQLNPPHLIDGVDGADGCGADGCNQCEVSSS